MAQSQRIERLKQPPAEAYGPEHLPTFTLDRQIADARASMGEARWARLNREFSE